MGKSAEGENHQPGFTPGPVEYQPSSDENDQEEQGMAEYAAAIETLLEEKSPDWFINDIGKKRADK
jgi:hypothetical protein